MKKKLLFLQTLLITFAYNVIVDLIINHLHLHSYIGQTIKEACITNTKAYAKISPNTTDDSSHLQ